MEGEQDVRRDKLIQTIDETLALLLDVADEYLDGITEQFENVGSPEKLIGKPYESWSPQDLQMMIGVYGTSDDSPLAKLIFREKYKEVLELEKEEL